MELDAFTASYLETALWSSNGDDGEPLDDRYSVDDFAPCAIACAIADCAAFQRDHADVGTQEGQAGCDFWLTRNRHGAGFWDGDWGEAGDRLTDASRAFGEIDLYVGDDGLIYMAPTICLCGQPATTEVQSGWNAAENCGVYEKICEQCYEETPEAERNRREFAAMVQDVHDGLYVRTVMSDGSVRWVKGGYSLSEADYKWLLTDPYGVHA